MAKTKETNGMDRPDHLRNDEDEATLAAIDEGLKDAKAARTVPLERVRELLPKWTSESSSPKKR